MNTTTKQINRNTVFTTIKTLSAGALLAFAVSLPGSALAQAKPDHAGHHIQSQEVKLPQTAQEHREMAKQYRQKAEAQRAEVATHKKMLADYSKGVAKNPKDLGENPYVKKMRLHCEKYIKAAEALATEAEEMAKFHELRAKELEGK